MGCQNVKLYLLNLCTSETAKILWKRNYYNSFLVISQEHRKESLYVATLKNFPKITMQPSCFLSLPSSSFLKKPSLPCLPGWQVVLFVKNPFSPLTSYCPHPALFHLSALVPWLSLAGLSLQTIITALRLVGVRCCRQMHSPSSPTPKLPAKLWLRSIIPDLEIKLRGLAW